MKDVKKTISAGGIVRNVINDKIYIVLIRETERPNWLLPKGHQEKGETIEQTAIREVKEETGLENIKILKKLGIKKRLSYIEDEYKTIHYFLFECLKSTTLSSECIDAEKILKPKWFSIDDLPEFFWQTQKDIIKKNLNIIKTYGL